MRVLVPLLFGLAGVAVLVSLGLWQLRRLDEKQALLAAIEARVDEPAAALPVAPRYPADLYASVVVEGTVDGPARTLFDTWRGFGAGVRVIVPLSSGPTVVPVDLGVRAWEPGTDPAEAAAAAPQPGAALRVLGNLDWPSDARADGAVPIVVAREVSPATGITPVPVSTEGIPNNHLGYAIQWFGLALVWAGMTAFFLWRITRRTV